jgi:hypothetical protein
MDIPMVVVDTGWWLPIPESLMSAVRIKIQIKIQELGLNELTRFHDHRNKMDVTIGMTNDSAEETTTERYRVVWPHLVQFCIITGDYESAAILNDQRIPFSVDDAIVSVNFACFPGNARRIGEVAHLPQKIEVVGQICTYNFTYNFSSIVSEVKSYNFG